MSESWNKPINVQFVIKGEVHTAEFERKESLMNGFWYLDIEDGCDYFVMPHMIINAYQEPKGGTDG